MATTKPLTAQQAVANAVRLLEFAEQDTTNLQLMESFTRLAEAWTGLATLMRDGIE